MALCAGTLVLRASMNKRVQDRHNNILKAFAFLFEYAHLRVNPDAQAAPSPTITTNSLNFFSTSSKLDEAALLQEASRRCASCSLTAAYHDADSKKKVESDSVQTGQQMKSIPEAEAEAVAAAAAAVKEEEDIDSDGYSIEQDTLEQRVQALQSKLYGSLRRQEISYNLGRAFHHLDILHLAEPWYQVRQQFIIP